LKEHRNKEEADEKQRWPGPDRRFQDILLLVSNHGWGGIRRHITRQRSSHRRSQPNALGDSAILGIVKTSVCYLQASNRRLHRRQLCQKVRFADGLSVSQPSYFGGADIILR
jgi:hypothetical protein